LPRHKARGTGGNWWAVGRQLVRCRLALRAVRAAATDVKEKMRVRGN
jgi:hypothetical protein